MGFAHSSRIFHGSLPETSPTKGDVAAYKKIALKPSGGVSREDGCLLNINSSSTVEQAAHLRGAPCTGMCMTSPGWGGCGRNEQATREKRPPGEQVPATSSASRLFRNPRVNGDISVGLSDGVADGGGERACGVRAEFWDNIHVG